MKRIIYKYALALMGLAVIGTATPSCQDFLTIRPKSDYPDYLLFSTSKGFQDALVGLYVLARDVSFSPIGPIFGGYSQQSNQSLLEPLSCFWNISGTAQAPEDMMYNHIYTNEIVQGRIGIYYLNMFKVITNANLILKWVDDKSQNFLNETEYNMIKGETLALKTLIMFDLLRAFGPPPAERDMYDEKFIAYPVHVNPYPYDYLSYNDFMTKLMEDLDTAEECLGKSDPIVTNPVASLEQEPGWLGLRSTKMNYYALLGLKARVHLWRGEKAKALSYAKMVMNAKADGQDQFTFKSKNSYEAVLSAGDLMGTSEMMFGFSPLGKLVYTITGNRPEQLTHAFPMTEFVNTNRVLSAHGKHLQAIFNDLELTADGIIKSQDLRFSKQFYMNSMNMALYGKFYPFTNENNSSRYPVIRLAEMYLIAAECEPSLDEGAKHLNKLRRVRWLDEGKNGNNQPDDFFSKPYQDVSFANEAERMEWITGEYVREFYGEGQVFFSYKRLGLDKIPYPNMRFNTTAAGGEVEMDAGKYMLPIPDKDI